MPITKEHFGFYQDKEVFLYTLDNGRMSVRITNFGGIITELHVPDAYGRRADVVLGFDNLEAYLPGHLCFGAFVGRCANRIAGGRFELEGHVYQLDRNENDRHHLHGGFKGFHRRPWEAFPGESEGEDRLRLERISPHLEEGYPGELKVQAIYRLNLDNELALEFQAETDRPTIVNLTGHSYFNLAGHDSGSIAGHELIINAEAVTFTDRDLIPTGRIHSVQGGSYDFRKPRAIGQAMSEIKGAFDHNYKLNKKKSGLESAAVLKDPASGRVMTLKTSAVGLQFYTGQNIPESTVGKGGQKYGPGAGLCLEPQDFPNAVNTPGFPSVVLKPGQKYRHSVIYSFRTVND